MSVSVKWKDVVGYEGLYQVSDTGLVRSLRRGGRVLSTGMSGAYQNTTLSVGATKRTFTLHSLVASAFKGPRPQGYVVRHKDGDKLNNRASNLLYGTPMENNHDTKLAGKYSSKFRGVSFKSSSSKWVAKVGSKEAGHYTTELEAARAYDKYIIDNNIKDRALNNV